MHHSDCDILTNFIQLNFFEHQMSSDRPVIYPNRFSLKSCEGSAKQYIRWELMEPILNSNDVILASREVLGLVLRLPWAKP